MATTITEKVAEATQAIGSLGLRGSTHPIPRNHSLDKYSHFESTPNIGEEFSSEIQLSKIINAENADELIKDLAVLVSQRGVVFFRAQDINIDDQKILGEKLGKLSGKPDSSTLHIHPTTPSNAPLGDRVTVISSERRGVYARGDRSRLASAGWHSDITFEPVPSDYAILKIHTNPTSGGDTIWASAYEAYSRISPPIQALLEGLEAKHDAQWFKDLTREYGYDVRSEERGSPLNKGEDLSATHPLIRVNPVTGWKGLFVNQEFTKRIVGVTKDESDILLDYLYKVINNNHDLQVRFKWAVNNPPGIGDIAIWDNRSTFHTATNDYEKLLRVGDRVVSIGEKPYYDPAGKEWREARGIAKWEF